MTTNKDVFAWAVPDALQVPTDPLRLRLDFFHQSILLTSFEGDAPEKRMISATDMVAALASELTFSSGLVPDNTLWWQNTKAGPVTALYEPPRRRIVALEMELGQPPIRFDIPLPGLVFLCTPSRPPWVYAVKRKPTKETDQVYKAPLLNVFANGRSCPGNNKYPERVADIIESFFQSFFAHAGDLVNRSVKFPKDTTKLWKALDKAPEFPIDDLIYHSTISDLMRMRMD